VIWPVKDYASSCSDSSEGERELLEREGGEEGRGEEKRGEESGRRGEKKGLIAGSWPGRAGT